MSTRLRLEPIPVSLDWKASDITDAIETALDETMKAARDDFKKTTRTWATKVDFDLITARRTGSDLEAATGTDNKIYGYVTRGTKPHIIRPRKQRFLKFQTGYRAKTVQGRLGSNAGGASGSTVFTDQFVLHPGTDARDFEDTVAEKYQRVLQKRLQEAINKALAR